MTSADSVRVAKARSLLAEAQRLLEDEGLLTLVQVVGPTAVRGSCALNLMTWRDIDLSVRLPHEQDIGAFFDLGRAVATRFPVARMSYSNHFIRTDQPYNHGLYWGIRLLFASHEWKVDLWGFGDAGFRRDQAVADALRRRLEGADRLAILRIKDAVCHRPDYRGSLTSVDVYDAVLDYDVRTVEEFDRWWARRQPGSPSGVRPPD